MRYIYDTETYPNCFLYGSIAADSDDRVVFEISPWRNDLVDLINHLDALRNSGCSQVGFNNLHFDYPIIHRLMNNYAVWGDPALEIQKIAHDIIVNNNGWDYNVWPNKQYIHQIDLLKIHHFDNANRRTSLKALEFALRRNKIQELPIKPGSYLDQQQVAELKDYMINEDCETTKEFYLESVEQINFRAELTAKHGRDFTNHNDTKIGKDIFIMELEKSDPNICFTYESGRREPRQTIRNRIPLNTVIFPYVQFQHPELHRVYQWFLQQNAANVDGLFEDITAVIDGLSFDFGKGGIHASVRDTTVVADLDYMILDIDVISFYPSLAIVNNLYPEHLGQLFCQIYARLKTQRTGYAKGSIENLMLKLALNGVFGDSGSKYSPFFDMKYLLSTTINGQLLLCMLAEHLMKIDSLTMIQANTDGMTFKVRRDKLDDVRVVTDWWQVQTQLDLEEVEYSRMWIKDVNNYIGEYLDGSLKRKGSYETLPPGERKPMGWHQDTSGIVVAKAAEAALTRGVSVRSFIINHPDIMDFMMRAKVPKSCRLELGGKVVQRICRYLVTTWGDDLVRVSPPTEGYEVGQWKRRPGISDLTYKTIHESVDCWIPGCGLDRGNPSIFDEQGYAWDERINTKNRSRYGIRYVSEQAGQLVQLFNDIDGPIDRTIINYEYYIQRAERLVKLEMMK
jgi:hypothetical protein